MKSNYIYLNEYPNGAMYVGSHTWDGPEGVLDTNYHGSSHVAQLYNWRPSKEVILEIVSPERKTVAERYWILKYCESFGIHPAAIACDKEKNIKFTSQFKIGVMLNCHSNSAEQLVHDKDVWMKSHKTRLESGAFKRFQESGALTRSDEKRVLKARDHHNYAEVARKLSKTLRENGVHREYYSVLVERDRVVKKYKSVTSALKEMGLSSWQKCVCRHLKLNPVFERDGIVFTKVIN